MNYFPRASRWGRPRNFVCLLAVYVSGGIAQAQNQNPFSSFFSGPGGFRLDSASTSGVYYPKADALAGTVNSVISGTVAASWRHSGDKSFFNVQSSSTYTSFWQNSGPSAWNQMVHFTGFRQIAPRWSITGQGSGAYANTYSLLFGPSTFGEAAARSNSFDTLASSLLRAPLTSSQVASVLTTGTFDDAAARSLLFGETSLNTSAGLSLAYTPSNRTTVSINATGSRTQPIAGGQNNGGATNLLSSSLMTQAQVNVSHSLTPRTQVGFTVEENRTSSNLQELYRTSTLAFLGRRMSMRWLVQIYGGTGYMNEIRTIYPLPSGMQYEGGGGLAYSANSHTFLMSAGRTFGDRYGIGATGTVTTSAAWNWSPVRSKWRLFANGSSQQFERQYLSNLRSWQTIAGVSRRLSSTVVCSAEYAYRSYNLPQRLTSISQSGVQFSVIWLPENRAGHR